MKFFQLKDRVSIKGAGLTGTVIGYEVSTSESHYIIRQDNGLRAEVAAEDLELIDAQKKQGTTRPSV